MLGTELKVTTTTGEILRGELFCHDVSESNTFVLREKARSGRVNFYWLKCSTVRDLEVTGVAKSGDSDSSSAFLPPLDTSTLASLERRGEELFSNSKFTTGVGVTQEAQEVFDGLSKTMPCSWSGDQIHCFRVVISSPYRSDDCVGPDANEVMRVRKVLEGERTKMADKKRRSCTPPAAVA